MTKCEENLKSLLRKVKEESETFGLNSTTEMKIMAFCPITSWQIDQEAMETERDFILGGSEISANDDCTHETKTCLLV